MAGGEVGLTVGEKTLRLQFWCWGWTLDFQLLLFLVPERTHIFLSGHVPQAGLRYILVFNDLDEI
jgi:hypothetical protein